MQFRGRISCIEYSPATHDKDLHYNSLRPGVETPSTVTTAQRKTASMITNRAVHLTTVGFTLLAALASPSYAANWYVDNGRGRGGNDNNAGTSLARPFRTIGKAAAVAKAGDTVLVRTGTYRETVVPRNSGRAGAPIVFQPYRNEAVTLSGAHASQAGKRWTTTFTARRCRGTSPRTFQSNQVLVNERMVHLARWPNNRGTLTRPTDAIAVRAADAGEGKITFTGRREFQRAGWPLERRAGVGQSVANQDWTGANRHCCFDRTMRPIQSPLPASTTAL
jgi:hypothetical protein